MEALMRDEPNDPLVQLQSAWQSQPVEPRRISLDEVRALATTFQRRIWRRNAREYVASAIVVIVFGVVALWVPEAVLRVGFGLLALGAAAVGLQLFWRGGSRPLPTFDGSVRQTMLFHRDELTRQRALLRTVWWWYLGPWLPGMVVVLGWRLGRAMRSEHESVVPTLLAISVVVAVFVFVGWLNAFAAKKLQVRIEALDHELNREQS
jgi:hypothetical protein